MAKTVHDDVLDGAFDVLDQANLMIVCSAQPTSRTEAVTTYALADVTMTPNTDFTKANGDVSGRKVTVAAKSSVLIDVSSSTADFVALVDSTRLLYVTTCTRANLTANGSNTVNFPAWDIEIADPT